MVVMGALTADTVEKLSIVMAVVVALLVIVVIRSSVKLISKMIAIAILCGVGATLFQNRVELGRCSQTCACTIYGQDVEVPHLPFSCNY